LEKGNCTGEKIKPTPSEKWEKGRKKEPRKNVPSGGKREEGGGLLQKGGMRGSKHRPERGRHRLQKDFTSEVSTANE